MKNHFIQHRYDGLFESFDFRISTPSPQISNLPNAENPTFRELSHAPYSRYSHNQLTTAAAKAALRNIHGEQAGTTGAARLAAARPSKRTLLLSFVTPSPFPLFNVIGLSITNSERTDSSLPGHYVDQRPDLHLTSPSSGYIHENSFVDHPHHSTKPTSV